MSELIAYNVVLYPQPGYFRHFLVFAKDPHDAVHKLNYQARTAMSVQKEKYPNNKYGKLSRLKHIITATRRYTRYSKPRWADNRKGVFCTVNEIPTGVVYEGQLNFGPHTESLIQNFLPDLLHPPIGNE